MVVVIDRCRPRGGVLGYDALLTVRVDIERGRRVRQRIREEVRVDG